jgi:hypothetical protein
LHIRQPSLSVKYPKGQRFKQARCGQIDNAKIYNNICRERKDFKTKFQNQNMKVETQKIKVETQRSLKDEK